MNVSVEELRAARSRDPQALESLIAKAEAIVRSMLRARDREGHRHMQIDHDDLCQDVLTQVLSGLTGFRGDSGGSFVEWLRTIVGSKLMDALRRSVGSSSRRLALRMLHGAVDCIDPPDSLPGPLERASAAEQRVLLCRAVATLPDSQQELIKLRFFDELPFCEIAERLGLASPNAAECSCRRARKHLLKEIAHLGADPEVRRR
jgi:RNA polymerase sigma-70 factor (ECF subfamily)